MRVCMVVDTTSPPSPLAMSCAHSVRGNHRITPSGLQERRPRHGFHRPSGIRDHRRLGKTSVPESPQNPLRFRHGLPRRSRHQRITAFFGMEIPQAKKGETLVVSAAAGATGSIAGQSERFKAAASLALPAATKSAAGSPRTSALTLPSTTSSPTGKKNSPQQHPPVLTSILKMSVAKSCTPFWTA